MKRYIALALVALSSMVWADDVVLDTVTVTGGTNYQVQQKLSAEEFKRSFHVQETSPGMTSPYVGAYTGNLLNNSGRVLGSSVDVAGRSLIFGAKYTF